MIVAMAGEKGGTGKTTLGVNLAGMRAASGRAVALVDSDRQGSASHWARMRANQDGAADIDALQIYGRTLGSRLVSLSSAYDDFVLDLGAGDTDELSIALRVADVLVVPVKASAFDMWTMRTMDERIGEEFEGRCVGVLNSSSTNARSKDAERALRSLRACDYIKMHKEPIRERVVFRRCVGSGLTVCEYRPRVGIAVDEMRSLYKNVFGEECDA